MSDGGKGSSQRPLAVDQKTFDDNFDRIFGKGKRDEKGVVSNPDVPNRRDVTSDRAAVDKR